MKFRDLFRQNHSSIWAEATKLTARATEWVPLVQKGPHMEFCISSRGLKTAGLENWIPEPPFFLDNEF